MANNVESINLLPGKGESVLTQFLNWALSIGRLLIIITETLALGTFLYRFSLDMKIVDLHDHIKKESIIVGQLKNPENKFRDLQERLSLAKTYDAKSLIMPQILNHIVDLGRGKVTFLNLTVSSELVKIEAQSPSPANISAFVETLKNSPQITSVSVDNVENKTSSAVVVVVITASIKKT